MPPEKLKLQPFVNFDPNKFSTYYFLFKIELNKGTQKDEKHDSIDEKIEADIKGFFVTENLNAETEKKKLLTW